mgnify:CR=1 FL=1
MKGAAIGKEICMDKVRLGMIGSQYWISSFQTKGMLEGAMESCSRIRMAIQNHHIQFCYAENWIYAPSLAKIKRIVKVSGGTIMDIRAEESHSGSHATYSRQRKTSGGGALLRLGAHAISAVLHLKHVEGMIREGKPIRPKSVIGEVGKHTRIPCFQREFVQRVLVLSLS